MNQMKSICCYSSLLFITNVILSYLYKDYIYTFLFIYLTISSVIHHSNKTLYTYIFDKIAVISVVIYGFIQFRKKINMSKNKIIIVLIILSFLLTIYLYYYGYISNTLCFDDNNITAEKWHCLLHLISSIGHNLIIIL